MKFALTFLASVASAVNLDVMSTAQSFTALKEQPWTFLTTNAYCNTSAGHGYRISMNPGHTENSCNDLCLKTAGCKRFFLGRAGGYKNRCDLVNTEDCEIVPKLFNFDYFQPTQRDQVRLKSSHKSSEDPGGCGSMIHPQNYLGVRPYGTQAECTNACWAVANCFAFNMHRGSHCHLYSADYPCGKNSQQDKYYMDFGDAAPPPPPSPQAKPTLVAPESPNCKVKPFNYEVIDMRNRINYHESEEIIRDTITNVGAKGVRMASPSEVDQIIANNTATGGQLTGSYGGQQWVATEGPYHTQEYVQVGNAHGSSIGTRYVRTFGDMPKFGLVDGADQGTPVQAGEVAVNTHILFVVDCTEPEEPIVTNPAANTIAVRGEKQWQEWAQDQNDQLDRQTEAAQTRIPYKSE